MNERSRKKTFDNIKNFYDSSEAVDYKSIKELKQRAGVTPEYLKECAQIHKNRNASLNKEKK